MTADEVADLAAAAPMGQYLHEYRLTTGARITDYDAATGLWTIQFYEQPGRTPVFRAVINDRTRLFEEQTIQATDGSPAPPMGQALEAVLRHPDVGPWLERTGARMAPEYDRRRNGWIVRIEIGGEPVGHVYVTDGGVMHLDGPWIGAGENVTGLHRLREALRPGWTFRQVAAILVLVFLGLAIDWRRPISWRTADALALAACVPAMHALDDAPVPGYGVLIGCAGYVMIRLLIRCRSSRTDPPPARRHAVALAALIAVCLAWQVTNAFEAERSESEYAGILDGRRFFEEGAIPYVKSERDTYGPFHYVLYGLIEKAFPSTITWNTPDLENRKLEVNLLGARVAGAAFHLLCGAALVAMVRRLGGRTADGLFVACAYLILSIALGRFFVASQVPPATLIAAGLWAWPIPVLAGVCLGLATAQMWFPVILVPLWIGAYRGRDRLRFGLAYAAVGAVFFGVVLLGPGTPMERLRTAAAQVGARQNPLPQAGSGGADPTYFWGMFPEAGRAPGLVRNALGFTHLALCAAVFIPALLWKRGRFVRVILISGALLAGTQLWRASHGGEYVGWYLPLALVGLFAPMAFRDRARDGAS